MKSQKADLKWVIQMNAREKLRSLNVSQGDCLKSSLEMTFNVFERQEESKK